MSLTAFNRARREAEKRRIEAEKRSLNERLNVDIGQGVDTDNKPSEDITKPEPETAEDTAINKTGNLTRMNKTELLALAANKNLSANEIMTKKEIIDLITGKQGD